MGEKDDGQMELNSENFDLSQLEQQFLQEEQSESLVQQLQKTIRDLNQQIELQQKHIEELTNYDQVLVEKNVQIKSLEDKLHPLKTKLNKQKKQISQINELKKKVEELTKKNSKLVAELRLYSTPQATLQDRYKSLQIEHSKREVKINSLEEQLEKYKKESKNSFELQKQIKILTTEIQTLENDTELKKLHEKSHVLSLDLEKLRADNLQLQQKYDHLWKEHVELKNNLETRTSLKTTENANIVSELENQIKSMQISCEKNIKENDKLKADKLSLKQKNSKLEQSIFEKEQEFKAIQTESASQIEQLKREIEENHSSRFHLDAQIQLSKEEIKNLTQKIDENREKFESDQQEQSRFSQKMQEKVQEQEEKIHQLQSNLLLTMRKYDSEIEKYHINISNLELEKKSCIENAKNKFEHEIHVMNESLESKKREIEKNFREHKINIEKINQNHEREKKKLTKSISEKDRQILELQNKSQEKQALLPQFKEKISIYEEEIQKLKDYQTRSADESKEILQNLNRQLMEEKETNNKLNQTILEIQTHFASQSQSFDIKREKEIKKIEKQILTLKNERKIDQNKILEGKQENSKLKEKNSDYGKTIEKLKTDLEDSQAKFNNFKKKYEPAIKKYQLITEISQTHEKKHAVNESFFSEKISKLKDELIKLKKIQHSLQSSQDMEEMNLEIQKLNKKITNLQNFLSR
ncbi:hypothetical protein NEF87_001708 [Candidatus Lokiarchaeum ossiferum]|uniref:Uncharacterized protein n=1 Tax=Candidatus Lokiarchaeum ossiferum TaxID=2951803 RepID=A0ABY6HQ15_9ARCH|nr:hypothetical protein NEF87_001708 [Candidatus Lokiarchaeum sp. B-35]